MLMLTICLMPLTLTEDFDSKAEIIKLHAFAPNTLKTRRSQWKRYQDFCERLSLPAMPISPQTICRFLVDIGDHLSYATLNNYVSALNTLGKFYHGAFDLRKDFGVQLLLRGFKRLKGDNSSPKDPLLPSDLKKMFKYVVLSDHAQSVMWLIIVLAFCSMLRKSHFMSSSDDDQEHLLRVADVRFEPWGCVLAINSSKTIQFGERLFEIPISFSSPPLCAASLLKSYLENYPKPDSELLLTLPKNSIPFPVSYPRALDFLKSLASRAGITKDIGFHSLRRGSATYMHMLNVDLISIQKAGDWLSLSVLKYLSVDFEQKRKVEHLVAPSL